MPGVARVYESKQKAFDESFQNSSAVIPSFELNNVDLYVYSDVYIHLRGLRSNFFQYRMEYHLDDSKSKVGTPLSVEWILIFENDSSKVWPLI